MKKNKDVSIDKQTYKISSSEIRSKSGEVLVKYENGKFYNSKGKEIDIYKARDILDKASDNLASLIQKFKE